MALADSARLLAILGLDSSGFDAGVKRATGSLGGLESRMGKIGGIASAGARTAGRNLERGLVLGIGAVAGALTYSAKAAIDWESAFTGVRKTVDATANTSLEQLEQNLLGLAKTMPVTAEDLAAIAENAGAMGISADDITEFTRQVAILGATTDVSTEQASTAIGQLQNIIGLTGDEFDNFAASLVALGNAGNSTEAQILEIERRAAGAARLFGIAKEETLGWSAAAANLGINNQLAGTSLQTLFVKLLPAYREGSKALMEVTGQTAEQLKKSWKEDASGSVEFFIKKLGELGKGKRLDTIQDLFGTGSGMTRLVNGLADSYKKNLAPSLEEGVKAWKEAAAAQAEYEKRAVTTEAQLQILGNNVKIAAATIGKELLPVIIDLAKEGVAFLDAHTDDIKTFAKQVGQGARDAVSFFKGIDWSGVANSLQAGLGFAKGLVGAFLSLPAPIQGFLATGFAANKFTGGAVVSIVGEVGKGLLSGFANVFVRAGIGKAFVQPVFVTNPGFGLGGGKSVTTPIVPGGKTTGVGRGAGALGLLGGAFTTLFVAELAAEFGDEIQGFGDDLGRSVREQLGISIPEIKLSELEWPFGPKNTPTILPELFGGNGLLGGDPAKPNQIADPIVATLKAQTAAYKTAIDDVPADQVKANVRTHGKLDATKDAIKLADARAQRQSDRIRERTEANRIAIKTLEGTLQTKSEQIRAAEMTVRDRVESNRITTQAGLANVRTAEQIAADQIVAAIRALDLIVNVGVSVSGGGQYQANHLTSNKPKQFGNP